MNSHVFAMINAMNRLKSHFTSICVNVLKHAVWSHSFHLIQPCDFHALSICQKTGAKTEVNSSSSSGVLVGLNGVFTQTAFKTTIGNTMRSNTSDLFSELSVLQTSCHFYISNWFVRAFDS